MDNFRREITRSKRHNLGYYDSHLELIELYIEEKPDISIETCKAIIEGVSKLSLHVLTGESLKTLDKEENLSKLCKRALLELQKGRGFSDAAMCQRLSSIVHYLGEVRNAHGDIGHGRASLKDQVNDADFAELIIGITDLMGTYMLRRLEQLAEKPVEYEDNHEFNEYLDELHDLPGKVLYSRALFEQEPENYEVELGDWLIERGYWAE
ncbi:MAG: abortive infection family protein [Coraliomargarita sp.]|nr:abortive infection family protein [Coraliomargarita sp.]